MLHTQRHFNLAARFHKAHERRAKKSSFVVLIANGDIFNRQHFCGFAMQMRLRQHLKSGKKVSTNYGELKTRFVFTFKIFIFFRELEKLKDVVPMLKQKDLKKERLKMKNLKIKDQHFDCADRENQDRTEEVRIAKV